MKFFKFIFLFLLLLPSCVAINTITEGNVVAHFIAGCEAENNGDLNLALEHYEKAKEAANKSESAILGYIPTSVLPKNERRNVSTTRLEHAMIYEAIIRVNSQQNDSNIYSEGNNTTSTTLENESSPNEGESTIENADKEFELKGRIIKEDESKEPLVIVFKNIFNKSFETKSDENGSFNFIVYGRGTLYINYKQTNQLYKEASVKITSRHFDGRFNNNRFDLEHSAIGSDFFKIQNLFKENNYPQVINYGIRFLSNASVKDELKQEIGKIVDESKRTIEFEQSIKKMRAEFDIIIELDKEKNYDLIIQNGKNYISEYSKIEESKWQEIDEMVKKVEIEKKEKLYDEVINFDKNTQLELILEKGYEYVSTYKDIDSKWEKINNRIQEAKKIKRKKSYMDIINFQKINKQKNIEYYEKLISAANAYLEEYENDDYKEVHGSHRAELAKIIKEAELSKKSLEEKIFVEERRKEEKLLKDKAEGLFKDVDRGINFSLNDGLCWSVGVNDFISDLQINASRVGFRREEDTRGTYSYFPTLTFQLKNISKKVVKINRILIAYTTGLSASDVLYVDKIYLNQNISPGKQTKKIISKSKFGFSAHRFPAVAVAFGVNESFCEAQFIRIGDRGDFSKTVIEHFP